MPSTASETDAASKTAEGPRRKRPVYRHQCRPSGAKNSTLRFQASGHSAVFLKKARRGREVTFRLSLENCGVCSPHLLLGFVRPG